MKTGCNFTLLVLIQLLLFACNSEDITTMKSDTVRLNLKFEGEILDITEKPLTKSTSNDIYIVQVYYYPKNSTTLTPYAYGFFNDISDISLDVYQEYKYDFKTYCFKNGMDYEVIGGLCHKLLTGGIGGESVTPDKIENKFNYSTEYWFGARAYEGLMSYDESNKTNKDDYYIDYYYSQVSNYQPKENGTFSFNMIRCILGFKLITENLKEGSIKVLIGNRDIITLTPEKTSFETTTTFYSLVNPSIAIWEDYLEGKDFTEETTIKVTYIGTNNMENVIYEDNVSFTRNKQKIITIKLKDSDTESLTKNSINFNFEKTEMGSDDPLVITEQ